MTTLVRGSCLCGTVRYALVPPTKFCTHCHCEYCRRAHGAAFVTWFGVMEEGFKLEAGEETLRWYVSSTLSERGFCTRCGTTLFFRSQAAPGEIHIALATADGPIDREPSAHVFFDQHVPWVTVDERLPRVLSDDKRLAGYKKVGARTGRR